MLSQGSEVTQAGDSQKGEDFIYFKHEETPEGAFPAEELL
jgi:hypothetical protein